MYLSSPFRVVGVSRSIGPVKGVAGEVSSSISKPDNLGVEAEEVESKLSIEGLGFEVGIVLEGVEVPEAEEEFRPPGVEEEEVFFRSKSFLTQSLTKDLTLASFSLERDS